jgi:PAS domain S-box-containing protein
MRLPGPDVGASQGSPLSPKARAYRVIGLLLDLLRSPIRARRGARGFARSYAVVGVVGVAGLLLTAGAFSVAQGIEARHEQAVFAARAGLKTRAVRQAIDKHLLVLTSVRSLFLADDDVTRKEFSTAAAPLIESCGPVQALEWLPRVRRAEREEFEERVRGQGVSDFRITQRDAQGNLVPATLREEYFPVGYVEPMAGNAPALGFDLGSDPIRAEVLNQACETGQPRVTPPLRLVQERGTRSGVLMVVPVYQGPVADVPRASRHRDLLGFVLMVLRVDDCLNESLKGAAEEIQVAVVDVTEKESHFLAVRPRQEASIFRDSGSVVADLQSEETVVVGGRTWRITCAAGPAFAAANFTWYPLGTLAIGTVLTLVLSIFLVSLRGRAARIQALVEIKTAALAENEAYLNTVLNSVDAGIILIDPATHTLVDVNRAAAVLVGLRRAEMIGKPCFRFICLAQEGQCPITDKYMTVDHSERVLMTADGREVPVMKTVVPVTVNGRPHLLESFFDIRGQKAAQAATEEINRKLVEAVAEADRLAEEAKKANTAKSEFLANMSHEIRTPMNGIMGMMEILMASDLSDQQRYQARTAYRCAESLLVVLNDILDFSKIEAGKLELDPEPLDLRAVIEEAAHLLAPGAMKSGIEIITRYAPGTPCHVRGDTVRIRQIVTNLLGNAVKFTQRGHVLVSAEATAVRDGTVDLHLAVSDSGAGIPADKLEMIFEQFAQADTSTTRRAGGTGLGLTISRRLVEMMGGRIWAESRLGEGSTFHFTLVLPVESAPAAAVRLKPDELLGMRVLVVDDHPVNRQVLGELLAGWGLVPELVADGPAALRALAAARDEGKPFPIVLADVCMPVMDGLEFCRQVRRDATLQVKAIMMLSSLEHGVQAAQCRELGIGAYLVKPVRQEQLFDALLLALGRICANPAALAPVSPVRVGRPLHVLLAEDNAVNQEVATALLKQLGCSVALALDGREAVEAVHGGTFDVVFMDVQMPTLDGFEATRQIRQWEKASGLHVPIIAMTAYALKGDNQRCLDAGMDGYVTKPISGERLAAALRRFAGDGPAVKQEEVTAGEQEVFIPSERSESRNLNGSEASAPAGATGGLPARVHREQAPTDGAAAEPPVLAVADLLQRCMNQPAIALRVMEKFRESVPDLVRQLAARVARSDTAGAKSLAHTLKGAAANVSAERVRAAAATLEKQCAAGADAAAQTTLLTLEVEMKRCLDSMAETCAQLAAVAKN